MKKLLLPLIILLLIVVAGCMQQAGTNDETVIKSAKVRNPDFTAAANVNVKVFSVNDTNRIPAYLTTTDKSGNYSVELDEGMFNIMIGNDRLAAFQDSVSIGENYSTLKDDTLATTVVLKGNIIMEPNHDPQTVTVQIVGTDRFVANVASDGTFIIPGIARGEYVLRCASTHSEYTPMYKNFSVDPSAGDTARVTVTMIYTGIPVVKNLRLSYDTLAGIINLSWDTLSYFMFKEFVVFKTVDSVLGTAPFASTTMCSFADPLYSDSIGQTVTYYVAVKTQTLETGPVFKGVATKLFMRFSVRLIDTAQWCINKPIALHATVDGFPGTTYKYFWQIGRNGEYVEGSGLDTTITPSPEMLGRELLCRVKVTVDNRLSFENIIAKTCGLQWEELAYCPTSFRYITTVVFKDQLLLYDSYDNVFSSSDGKNWEKIARSGLSLLQGDYRIPVAFNNQLCTIDKAGYMFTSVDGITWEKGISSVCSTQATNYKFGKPVSGVFVYDNKMYVQPLLGTGHDSLLLMSSDLQSWQPSTMKIKASVIDYVQADGKTYLSGLTFKTDKYGNLENPDSMWYAIIENGSVRTYNSLGFTAPTSVFNSHWYNIEVFRDACLLSESAVNIMELRWLKDMSSAALSIPVNKGGSQHTLLTFRDQLFCISEEGVYRALW